MNARHAAALVRWARMALDAQVRAAQHIRDCERCSQIFLIAYDEAFTNLRDTLDSSEALATLETGPNAFRLTADVWIELRKCPDWNTRK